MFLGSHTIEREISQDNSQEQQGAMNIEDSNKNPLPKDKALEIAPVGGSTSEADSPKKIEVQRVMTSSTNYSRTDSPSSNSTHIEENCLNGYKHIVVEEERSSGFNGNENLKSISE